MNGKFFKILYNSTMKLVPCADNFDKFLSSVAASFSVTPAFVRSLVCTYKDKDDDSISIGNQSDYDILIKSMVKDNLKTVKITLIKNEARCEVGTTSEFELLPSQDFTVQTDETQKNVEIQTERREEEAKGCQTRRIRKKKPQPDSMEFELKQAKKDVKQMVRKELKPIKEKLFNEMYQKLEAQIRQKYNIDTNMEKIQNVYNNCQTEPTLAVHNSSICDGCHCYPIIGNRYRCKVCPDFDYCENCKEKFGMNHGHPFEEITKAVEIKQNLRKPILIKNNHCVGKVCLLNTNSLKQGSKPIFTKINVQHKRCGRRAVTCLNSSLNLQTKNNKTEFKTFLHLRNDGRVSWPNPCYLKCVEGVSDIKGETIKISQIILPGKDINIEVTFNLSQISKSGKYKSTWQLQNEKREYFGDAFTFIIDCIYENTLKIKPQFVEIYNKKQEVKPQNKAIDYKALVKEMRKEFDIYVIEDDNAIMNALILTGGNKVSALNNLLNSRQNACYYGTYDQFACKKVSTTDDLLKDYQVKDKKKNINQLAEEKKKDFDMQIVKNDKEIVNELINTDGNKVQAFNNLLTEKKHEQFYEEYETKQNKVIEEKGIKYYDIFEEMKNDFDIGMIEEDNTIMNALIRNKGNKIKALNEMLDKRGESLYNDSNICNEEEEIKYCDLLEGMKRDFDVKNISNNVIINALIATKGNKVNALNKILGEREYNYYN